MLTKKNVLILGIIFIGAMLLSFITPQEKTETPWLIPAKYKAMKNTYKSDASLVKVGKMLYSKHCRSCHGNKGLGDGPKAKKLKTSMVKFNDAAFTKRTDGELYYMSIIGRDEMPNYEKKIIDDEDRWAVIMYTRTLK